MTRIDDSTTYSFSNKTVWGEADSVKSTRGKKRTHTADENEDKAALLICIQRSGNLSSFSFLEDVRERKRVTAERHVFYREKKKDYEKERKSGTGTEKENH